MNAQRSPECVAVNCAAPLELVAKVKTLIENETLTVASWTRAGHKASGKRKQMGVSRFFIEAVAKAVEGVEASEKHLKWAESIREKNRKVYSEVTRQRWEERRLRRGK